MAQSATIIPFPNKKITFEAAKISPERTLQNYDQRRQFVIIALGVITKSSGDLKRSLSELSPDVQGRRDGGHARGPR